MTASVFPISLEIIDQFVVITKRLQKATKQQVLLMDFHTSKILARLRCGKICLIHKQRVVTTCDSE
jgi:hypothetical protein